MFKKITHTNIKRISNVTPDRFLSQYKDTETPVILSNLTAQWPALKKWDIDYLSDVGGDAIVPVYSSKPASGKELQHAATKRIPLRDYLSSLKQGENDLRVFFYNILKGVPSLLKDFTYPHIGLNFFKRLPVLFIGGRGTKVQMHYDVDMADLILIHFGGRKHVALVSPDQEKYLYRVPFSYSALHSVDLSNPDFEKFPALKKVTAQIAILEHGDALFIPSGYWHYIVYEDIGFSLTLRALRFHPKKIAKLAKNILFTRTIEAIMRKLFGQKWNERNEALAVKKTHQRLAKEP